MSLQTTERLENKLISTNEAQMATELNKLLDKARVSISWWGERLVEVDGYAGSVTIDQLATEFLRVDPRRRHVPPGLQERMHCYKLWDRVQKLYDQSYEQLKKTYLYRFLVPLLECPSNCCREDSPMAIIGEWDEDRDRVLFNFTQEELDRYFPAEQFPELLRWAYTVPLATVEKALKLSPKQA